MPVEKAPICEAVTINRIEISVSDLRRSKDWYVKTFGLRVIQESTETYYVDLLSAHA